MFHLSGVQELVFGDLGMTSQGVGSGNEFQSSGAKNEFLGSEIQESEIQDLGPEFEGP